MLKTMNTGRTFCTHAVVSGVWSSFPYAGNEMSYGWFWTTCLVEFYFNEYRHLQVADINGRFDGIDRGGPLTRRSTKLAGLKFYYLS